MAGPQVRDIVVENLNRIGNVMSLQYDAVNAYDRIEWAIQADEVDNKVFLQLILNYFIMLDLDKVTYSHLQEACRRGYSWPRPHPPWGSAIIWKWKGRGCRTAWHRAFASAL